MDHTNSKIGTDAPPSGTPNWTINVSDVRTVKVSNISLATSEKDIKEFFSFSGDIQYVEMQRETETSQLAYVTFKESQGADTAMLLTGSTIADLSVSITRVENYQLPPDAPPLTPLLVCCCCRPRGCCLLGCCCCCNVAVRRLLLDVGLLDKFVGDFHAVLPVFVSFMFSFCYLLFLMWAHNLDVFGYFSDFTLLGFYTLLLKAVSVVFFLLAHQL